MDEAKQKFCLTSLERAWILYDVGNSAFVLLVATLIPIFFNALAEGGGLSSVEYLYLLRGSGRDRLLRHGDGKHLAAVPAHLHLCQGGLFRQSGVL